MENVNNTKIEDEMKTEHDEIEDATSEEDAKSEEDAASEENTTSDKNASSGENTTSEENTTNSENITRGKNNISEEATKSRENVNILDNVSLPKINEDLLYLDAIMKSDDFESNNIFTNCLDWLHMHFQKFYPMINYQLMFLYLEIVFHLLVYGTINKYIIIPILFSLPAGAFLSVIIGIFTSKVNKILTLIFSVLICLLYCVQLVYHYIFKAFLSFYSVGMVGTDVLEFADQIFLAILKNIPGIMLLLLPILFFVIYVLKADLDKKNTPILQGLVFCGGLGVHFLIVLFISIFGKDIYSPYDLYHNTWVQDMSMEQLGVITTTRFDLERLIFKKDNNSLETSLVIDPIPTDPKKPISTTDSKNGNTKSNTDTNTGTNTDANNNTGSNSNSNTNSNEEPNKNPNDTNTDTKPNQEITPTVIPTPVPMDTSPNILDIDFEALAQNEQNKNVKTMHEYFAASTPTNKNEYTGMFEGYNLIMLTAEGFSPYAVDEKITPTLYKLINEGFVFKNFYTPLWWASTIDGEYVACTSLIPKSGVTSFYVSGSNSMPFALGNQFTKLGYSTRAYHNHTYTYYKRHVSHPNMGYEYKGVGNGLEITKRWPESDLEMMEVTIPEYIGDQPFHTYYMTVSGHMNYTYFGNSMATKNKEYVEDSLYSMEAQAYIACNKELDLALEKLLQELEAKGIADKTVIALSADHYPYGLEKEKIDELAGHEVEENFELYKNNFILWSASMKEPVVIDKVSSSLDIIPTISNLFGLPYDSRLFMGQDILSDADPLVVFSNRSFINDKVMYNSKTKEVTKLTEEELPDDYIKVMNRIVNNKFVISQSILEEDYYSYFIPKEE